MRRLKSGILPREGRVDVRAKRGRTGGAEPLPLYPHPTRHGLRPRHPPLKGRDETVMPEER
jgi:hypothetical protein